MDNTERIALYTERITAFDAELKKQTDRGVGIVAAAFLEDVLQDAIEARLVAMSNTRRDALFGRMRPLSSFSAKIELGNALGLYDDKLRHVLNMVRDVRNTFAHEMEAVDFNYPAVANLVQHAKTPNTPPDISKRNTFIVMVHAAMALLYAMLTADVRLKSLGESHPDIFVRLALAVNAFQHAQASIQGESPPQPQLEPARPPEGSPPPRKQ